jgi:amidophosphoribosyltransferase
MARDAGARKVFFCSAAPPIRYPNIYGIDIPTRQELIAYNRDEDAVAREIGCDWVVYQDLRDLEDSVLECKYQHQSRIADLEGDSGSGGDHPPSPQHHQQQQHRGPHRPHLKEFDTSCFSGIYVTGEKIGDDYFARLHDLRNDRAKQKRRRESLPPAGGGAEGEMGGGAGGGDETTAGALADAGDSAAAGAGPETAPPFSSSPPAQSNDGCESVSNDKRLSLNGGAVAGCETLTNDQQAKGSTNVGVVQ